jgi:hypothetical protein
MNRLLDFIIGREPVATATGIAGGVAALLGTLMAFDVLELDAEQMAAIGALVAWLAGWAARKAVTPVAHPNLNQRGSIPLALIILVGLAVVLVAGMATCGDALFEDEDETNDLGLPALILDHDRYGDDYGSDGNSGYDGEGGRSGDYDGGPGDDCRNACGNTIIVPSPGGREEEQPR